MLAVVPITSLKIWGVLILAVALLTPLTHAGLRRSILALLNLLFVGLCVGRYWPAIVGGVLVLYVLLRLGRRRQAVLISGLPVLGGVLALFALHKLPDVSRALGVAYLNPLLAGIGFSYVCLRIVDVWRAVHAGLHPPPSVIGLINYVLPFHMLAAGPIQSYDEYARQPAVPPPPDLRTLLAAADRIATGLFKKFVLAYFVAELFATRWTSSGWYLWLEINLHFLWIYLDFSAYSDIAVGCGRLLGVATPENFNRPYLARNLTDFWERWHITLSQFIRRHLFVPLQMAFLRRTGGRHALLGAGLALAVSFGLCGAWHGLTNGFLAWGLVHAGGLIVCTLYKEWLRRRLGSAALERYRSAFPVRAASVAATYQFAAFSLYLVGDQWKPGW